VYLGIVTEILQSIRQSDMSPMLSRIYGAPGGTEALDVLMKYMYGFSHSIPFHFHCLLSPPSGSPDPSVARLSTATHR
jgi:hypothetical protein